MKKVLKRISMVLIFIVMICGYSLNVNAKSKEADITQNEINNNLNDKDINGEHNKNIDEVKDVSIHKKEDVEKFIDDYFSNNMEKLHAAGASISVVDNNKTIINKSYGYSNLEDKESIDPKKTTFALCSGSKLFTACAIMKLYEENKIDLDKDINEYIYPYKVKNDFDRHVTCRNLLTHSSGIDESSELNSKTEYEDKILSQEEYMDMHAPVVVTNPDTISRYCNEGYNLLGYIVEKVSNTSYEEYIKENFIDKLNMNNTTVRVYDDNLAKGYLYEDNEYSEFPLLYQYTSGSSGIITTCEDMGKFMSAILNKGEFNGNRILNEDTIKMMEDKQFANDEIFAGMGLCFERSNRNGVDVVKHEGALPGYTSTTFLIPSENFGICILTNTLGALPFNFEEEFLNYFYDNNKENIEEGAVGLDLSRFEGSYRSYDGVSKTNVMKIFGIFEDTKIKDNKDGTLTLEECNTQKENIKTKLIPKGENIFIREDNKGNFAFRLDEKGNVIYAFNDVSFNAFEKVNFYEKAKVIEILLGLIFIMSIIDCIKIIINHKKQNKNKLNILNFASKIAFLIGLTGIIILVSIMSYNNDSCSNIWIYLFLLSLNISAVLYLISIFISIYTMFKNKSSYIKILRLYYVLNIFISLSVLAFMYCFNLIGFKIS